MRTLNVNQLFVRLTLLMSSRWGALLIVLLAAFLRFVRLDQPKGLVFDEVYYQRESVGMMKVGYELKWPDPGAPQYLFPDQPAFSVHPPLAKWFMVLFMNLFGSTNAYGYRFAAALMGTLLVAAVIWICHSITRSQVWSNLAGSFVALDTLSVTMSRIAMLDTIAVSLAVIGSGFLFAYLRRRIDKNRKK